MKLSRTAVRGKATLGMEVRFEPQKLTSYSGLILFQHFFSHLGLKERLGRCFRHLKANPIYGHHVVLLLLVVHLIIGHRQLQDLAYYRDDELVQRLLGLKRLPNVSTVSRSLKSADACSVDNVRAESRTVVLERLVAEGFATITLDFDGSVLSTGRHAEGAAVGFNKKKKGARSYYPLFCTVAQTDQVLDVHHRPGNVHDSKGADAFIERCVCTVRASLPRARSRCAWTAPSSAETSSIDFTPWVSPSPSRCPSSAWAELKGRVEGRRRWRPMANGLGYFETRWKPKSWNTRYRFVFLRKPVRHQNKEEIQLDLFKPVSHGYEFKVIVNKQENPHTQRGALPRRTGFPRGHLRRVEDPLPNGLRARQNSRREPVVHVRQHPRSQPHPRTPDANPPA